jgi:hypothetical protein
MRRGAKLGVLLGVLWAGVASANGWRGYASATTGLVIDHLTGVRAKGGALQLYAGVEAPMGLSLGVIGEGAKAWGTQIQGQKLELDYRSVGLELRLRFLRDERVSPWLGMRLSQSWSKPVYLDDLGVVRQMVGDGMSAAIRLGMDTWLGEHLGVTVSTAWQWCDVRVEKATPETPVQCAKPLQTVLGGPTFRF